MFPYQRVLVVGNSGAGKSCFSRALGEITGLPLVHLDRLWWLPGWAHVSREAFDRRLIAALQEPAWIIDGDFSRTFATRLKYADFCVFLDIDTQTCLQGARERISRAAERPDMTEGCPERPDPEFERAILGYAERTRPNMLRELTESCVPHCLFATRDAAWAYLAEIAGAADEAGRR